MSSEKETNVSMQLYQSYLVLLGYVSETAEDDVIKTILDAAICHLYKEATLNGI